MSNKNKHYKITGVREMSDSFELEIVELKAENKWLWSAVSETKSVAKEGKERVINYSGLAEYSVLGCAYHNLCVAVAGLPEKGK